MNEKLREELQRVILNALDDTKTTCVDAHPGLRIFTDSNNRLSIEWTADGRTVSIPMSAIAEKFPKEADTITDWISVQTK